MNSDAVKAVADKYFLKTGDQVKPPPPKLPPEPELMMPPQSAVWPMSKRERFAELELHALWVAGPRGPISPGLGHNRIRWPLLMGGTSSYVDNVTKNAKRWWPYEPMGVWFRIWVPTPQHVIHLQLFVLEVLEHELTLNPPWIDVEPEFNVGAHSSERIERRLGLHPLPAGATEALIQRRRFRIARGKLEQFILDVAARHGMDAWTDDGVSKYLDECERREMARKVGEAR